METIKYILNLTLWIFLFIFAIALVIALIPIALLWKIYVSIFDENRKARDIMSGTIRFFEAMAIAIDVFGGVAYSGFFNKVLLIKGKYKFGNPYETISEVLGWAQYYKDLTRTGKILVKILDTIDKNHCEKTRVHGILLAHKKLNTKL